MPPTPGSLPHVALIIVHWLNADDTSACLHSLRAVDYDALTVVLVNNGSPDFDAERFKADYPAVVILESPFNSGFAGGNNLGMTWALENGVDWVYLLNNDTVVEPNLISAMLPTMQNPDIALIGPVILFYDAPDRAWFAGGTYNPWVGYSYRTRPLAPFDGVRQSDWVNGCAMMIRRDVIENIGGLWDDLFLYCEDLEYCLRAVGAGYGCASVGAATVYHKVSSSSGKQGADLLSPNKAYYFARNYLLMIFRHARGIHRVTGTLNQFLMILPIQTLMMLRTGSLRSLPHYFAGLRDGLRGKMGKRP